MNTRLRSSSRSQAGVALVEFAIFIPVAILLLIGLIEIGRLAYLSVLLGNAANAGVQYGAQNKINAADIAGMRTAALNDGQNISGLTASPTQVYKCFDGTTTTTLPSATATCNPTASPRPEFVDYVQVTTTGSFTPLFNYPDLPSSFSISRTAQMRVSQ